MRHFTIILILLALFSGCSKKDQFIIRGHIEDGTGKKIYLYRMDLNQDTPLDSTTIKKDGSFKFKQPALSEPAFLKLALSSSSFITLLGDTTENIVVTAKVPSFARNYSVENSAGSKDVQMLKKQIIDLRTKTDSLINYFSALPQEERPMHIERISNEVNANIDAYKKKTGKFIMDNYRSFASYYALFLTLSDETPVLNIMDRQDQIYFSAIATSLNIFYPDSERVRQLYNLVLGVKAQERRDKAFEELQSMATTGAPDITEPDIKGKDQSLNSLRGKIVLLSFSASWDAASRRENQNLKRIYNIYKSRGFEVYQVNIERSRILWENALLQDEIPWISVSDLQYTDSYAARIYNVQKLPANYLLSREGSIIGKDLFGPRLEERLREELR